MCSIFLKERAHTFEEIIQGVCVVKKRLQNDSSESPLKNKSHTQVIHHFGNILQDGLPFAFLYYSSQYFHY